MTSRPRLLLSLFLALLMVFAQQAGYRHVLGHTGDAVSLQAAVDRAAAQDTQGSQPDSTADSRERTRLCIDCLALQALGGLPEMPASLSPDVATAELAQAAVYRSIPHPVPTPKAQAPPHRS